LNRAAISPAVAQGSKRIPQDSFCSIDAAQPEPRADEAKHPVAGNDGETIRNAQLGDAAAWEVLFQQNVNWIRGACRRWVGSFAHAEDLTQDVFLKVFQNLHSYRGERAGFRAWLNQITRNLLIDDFRRKQKEQHTISYDCANDRSKNVLESAANYGFNSVACGKKQEHRAALRKAFRMLSPELRKAVILRDVHGFTYEEISNLLNKPVGTVKSRVNRGRIQLAPLVRQYSGLRPHPHPKASAPV
jgi:RNA polymerase sigma-70 factor (ECF subfamily)